jgi:hypothetical protein
MSTTATVPAHVRSRLPGRVAAAASVVFGISMFWLVASVEVPAEASDEKLTEYWRGSEALTGATFSAAFALLAAICLMVVVNHVLAVSGMADGHLAGFVRSMATLCAACLVVVGAMRGTIAHLVRAEDLPLPDPDVLRYATSLGYSLLGLGTMGLLGATMLSASVLVLRSRVLGKWIGVVGSVCGVVTLGAAAVGFGAFATPLAILWGVCLGVALLRRGP